MLDNRRLLLIVAFVFSLNMLWTAWTEHNRPKIAPTQNTAQINSANTSNGQDLPVPSSNASPSTATPSPSTSAQNYADAAHAKVKTDVLIAEISALGGDITRLELTQHKDTNDKTKNFVLFDHSKHQYVAQSGFADKGLPNHKTLFKLENSDVQLLDGQDSVQLRLNAPAENGVTVTKILTFKRGSYLIGVNYEIKNESDQPLKAHAYYQLMRDEEEPQSNHPAFFGGATTYTGGAFYSDEKKYQKVAFKDIAKGDANYVKQATSGWVAMVQHYFVSAYVPQKNLSREFYARKVNDNLYAVGMIVPVEVGAHQSQLVSMPLYAGPQEQNKLKGVAPGFDLVVDYGMLTVIAAPLFWVLSWIHKVVGNWGWAIILVTVLLKLAFFPLSAASYKSMARMRVLMPRLKALQERHKDDRMKLNQEMMELYKKEKVNPMGGCLPILVQIPVFIALYWVLLGSVEMRQAPWLGWITDLSVKDPYFILPIIMGISMIVQSKLNPTPPDPIQAKVMMIMPLVFSVMFLWFPAGLVLYWVVNNLLSIAQQWSITRMIESGPKAK